MWRMQRKMLGEEGQHGQQWHSSEDRFRPQKRNSREEPSEFHDKKPFLMTIIPNTTEWE